MQRASAIGEVEAFLDARIAAGEIPGAAWGVWDAAAPARTIASGARGNRSLEPGVEAATPDTIYDLASLTKPVSTAFLLLLLEQEGVLSTDDPAGRWLPELAGSGKDALTLAQLAAHDSGLEAWRPFYVAGTGEAAALDQIARSEPASAPGERAVYSDPGYILLGAAVARAGNGRLDDLFDRRIAAPLGLTATRFLPPGDWRARIAPTERDCETERAMVAARGLHYDGWRSGVIRGAVHDTNAWSLGGVAGHAGLFGTVEDLIRIAREFLGRGRALLGSGAIERAGTCRTRAGEKRSIGWQLAGSPGSAAEGVLPPAAFGHTGFTGTSLWLDPEAGRAYVLLTNRVHPVIRNRNMNELRREFHRLAARIPAGAPERP